jgi:chorismate mutase
MLVPAAAATSEQNLQHLLELIQQRLQVAPLVAQSKWNSGAPINDPAREQQILDQVVAEARKQGVSEQLARGFFQAQFDAGKLVQESLHVQWREQQHGSFQPAPDLAKDVRPLLDKLTPELLTSLKQVQASLCETATQTFLAEQGKNVLTKDWGANPADKALSGLACKPQ